MNERQTLRWKKIRARGFLRFLLLYGIGLIGGVTFLLSLLGNMVFRERFDRAYLMEEIIFSVISGLIWGVIIWATCLVTDRRTIK